VSLHTHFRRWLGRCYYCGFREHGTPGYHTHLAGSKSNVLGGLPRRFSTSSGGPGDSVVQSVAVFQLGKNPNDKREPLLMEIENGTS
jgi:hypothetical protein